MEQEPVIFCMFKKVERLRLRALGVGGGAVKCKINIYDEATGRHMYSTVAADLKF
jgi:hypothetical protein